MRLSSLLSTAHTVTLASAVALPGNPSDQGTQLNTVDKSATSPPTNAAGLAKVLAFLFANNNMPITPVAAGTPPQKANSGTIQPTATTSANVAPQPGAVPQSNAVNGIPVAVPGQTKPGSQSVPTPPVNNTTGTTPVAPVAPPAPPASAPPATPVTPVTPGSPAPPVPAAPVTPKAPTTANPTSVTGGNTTSPTTGTPPAINKTRDANDAAVPDGNVVALKKRAGPFIINAQAPQPRPPQGPSPQKISGPKMIPNGMIGMVMPPTVSHLRRRAVPGLSGDDAKEFGMESFETADAIPSQDLLPVLTSPAMESENETIRQVYGEEALLSTSSAAASPIMGNMTAPAYDANTTTSVTGMITNTPLASNGTQSASSLAQQDEEALAFVTGGDYGMISADARAKTNSTANGLPGSSSPISTTGPGQAATPNVTTANMPMGAGMSGYMPSNGSAVARSDATSLVSAGAGTTALLVLAMMAVF